MNNESMVQNTDNGKSNFLSTEVDITFLKSHSNKQRTKIIIKKSIQPIAVTAETDLQALNDETARQSATEHAKKIQIAIKLLSSAKLHTSFVPEYTLTEADKSEPKPKSFFTHCFDTVLSPIKQQKSDRVIESVRIKSIVKASTLYKRAIANPPQLIQNE